MKELEEKLAKLKALLDSGIINQEDYDNYSAPIKKKMESLSKPSEENPIQKKMAQLKQLLDMGILDQAEYEKQKNELMAKFMGF